MFLANAPQMIELQKVFSSAPLIYTLLGSMSIAAMALWFYTLATLRLKAVIPEAFKEGLRALLEQKEWESAKAMCLRQPNLLGSIIQAGLSTRELGPSVMVEAMKSEGKRASSPLWQRLSLLNEIAVVAPMLGLLGTVIGMFYAFYDINRSAESVNALFDGLGVAVGTTVAGLIVAILAMVFSITMKYRMVKTLCYVENEATMLSILIPRP